MQIFELVEGRVRSSGKCVKVNVKDYQSGTTNRGEFMSEFDCEMQEYIEKYARDNCDGDIEEAKRHMLVKIVAAERENKDV